MISILKIKNTKTGFTLIELMVAISVFSIVILMSMGAVISILDANKKSQTLKSAMNNLNFAVNSIVERAAKFGTKFDCGIFGGPTDCTDVPSITFIDVDGTVVTYDLLGKQIFQRNNGDVAIGVTAPELVIESMGFTVSGTSPLDNLQPRVTMTVSGYVGENLKTRTEFDLQTTVTQRILDQ